MATAALNIETLTDGALRVQLAGEWRVGRSVPSVAPVLTALQARPSPARLTLEGAGLGRWDSTLVARLQVLEQAAVAAGVPVEFHALPDGVRRLLRLAAAVPERVGARRVTEEQGFLAEVGEAAGRILDHGRELLAFLGELTLALNRLVRGRARFSRSEFLLYIRQTGADALPIVSLISFLVGMIFAFVGVMQLEPFGVGIYVADLVAIAMVREMAAIMTGIIMAGRTGAAFAAELGTMKVNEEIDAFRTLGINVMDYLVLPRALALVLMMPLLTLYASLMGIIGGLLASLALMDLSLVQYVEQTKDAVGLNSLSGGLFKSLVYAIVVAVAGCQQGMACGGSAQAVGQATTSAVVMGILLIVVSASILTVIYTTLGI